MNRAIDDRLALIKLMAARRRALGDFVLDLGLEVARIAGFVLLFRGWSLRAIDDPPNPDHPLRIEGICRAVDHLVVLELREFVCLADALLDGGAAPRRSS